MSQIISYLRFNGLTKEAMEFYHQCLGGDLVIQPVSESPMAVMLPGEKGNTVLHSSLIHGNLRLMGTDMPYNNFQPGVQITLYINCSSREEINIIFSNLAVGGMILEPLHQSFKGNTSGKLTDKFGVHWMFNFSKNQIPF